MSDVTAEQTPGLIRRKLAPPPFPERLIARPRLADELVRAIETHRVTVVAGAAGAGKTTAVAMATAELERPRAWLSVDRTDSAAGRLVTYLEAAIGCALPHVEGLATRALSSGIPHAEAAGILAEGIGDAPLIIVLDDLERLGHGAEAWATLEAFLRYLPPSSSTLLLSRRDIPAGLCELPPPPAAGTFDESRLAFTADEATEVRGGGAAEGVAAPALDAIMRATGGWVIGVLYHAGGVDHSLRPGARSLPDYLSTHVLAQLEEPDRDFLVHTALLEEVDVESATALGVADAAERMESLRDTHLPISWDHEGRTMRCHPLVRDHLVELLQHRGAQAVRGLRVAHARLLIRDGHDEEAVDELLRAGALAEALAPAVRCIARVTERLDFAVAERWLEQLRPVTPAHASDLHVAELLIAMAHGHFRRGAAIGDRLEAAGERDRFIAGSDRAAGLLAWCYAEVGRDDDFAAVLRTAGPGPNVGAVHYTGRLRHAAEDRPRPELTGGPLDALVLGADHALGHFEELAVPAASRWATAVSAPFRVAALRASGRTQQALELYEDTLRTGMFHDIFIASFGADLLVDLGRRGEALTAIREGRAFLERNGGHLRWILTWVSEARLRLRLDRDPRAALEALAAADRALAAFPLAAAQESADTWAGFAHLLLDDVSTAQERLRGAVTSMVAGDRLADLSIAAAYLAEAEWRAGEEGLSDRAADLALAAAHRVGSDHLLLQALADFPAVVSRRIDAEPGTDSAWHQIGRALVARGGGTGLQADDGLELELRDLGRGEILVSGERRRPRLGKTYELLAYLALRPDRGATRDELLDALFDSRDDPSTRNYLRQVIVQLGALLPEPSALSTDDGALRLSPSLVLGTASQRVEQKLDEARTQHGSVRLATTLEALELLSGGGFLEGAKTAWVEERRRHLAALASGARHDAARLLHAAGRHLEAIALNEQVLKDVPLREDAWRLHMTILGALGDDAGVVQAYARCMQALAEIGAAPARSTRELLEQLRR
ncbi:MAG: transcriptional activator domain protein [Conexibacter sp.]|nr:transcriptional activator domain protein [Conexibacter sp.]